MVRWSSWRERTKSENSAKSLSHREAGEVGRARWGMAATRVARTLLNATNADREGPRPGNQNATVDVSTEPLVKRERRTALDLYALYEQVADAF